jgi:multidrug efflux pump subunit AcrA (membrane-fusion protein)
MEIADEEFAVKKNISGAIVTAVIVGLILTFTGLGAQTLMQRNRYAPGTQAAPGTQQTSVTQPAAGAGGNDQAAGQRPPGAAQGSRNATTVRVTPVVKNTIENSVVINGDVLAVNQVSIFPTVAGKITRTNFQVGDSINQGTVVAMVDPSRPGQIYSDNPVISTIGGTILQVPVQRGDTVSAQTAVYVVGDLSSLMIETFVPERFSNAARRGLPAQVFLEALSEETFQAVVEEVSPVLDPASRTLRIRLRFTGGQAGRIDPRIKAGMFATVSLVTNTRRDVAVIPQGSVINTYGSWIVFTVDEQNVASRREISLGLANESLIEVVRGLEIGDMVVIAGQNFLSDGDLVRIVE